MKRMEMLEEQIDTLTKESRKPLALRRLKADDELIQKYCMKYYIRTVKRYRQFASQNSLNRHWDGEDGIYYLEWYKKFGGVKTAGNKVPDDMKALVEFIKEEDIDFRKKEMDDAAATGQVDGLEYDWSDTEDMKKWESYIWTQFKSTKMITLADVAAAGFDFVTKSLQKIGINL